VKKRVLAIGLALALLLVFGSIGASAASPEDEGRALLEQTLAIFNSGTYTLKGRGHSPVGVGAGSSAPIVIAVDQDKVMTETEIDWSGLMQASSPGGDAYMTAVQRTIWQLVFGRKFRMVFSPEGVFWVFPERMLYIDMAALAGGVGEPIGLAQEFTGIFARREIPEQLTVTQPVIDGKTYLCVTLDIPENAGTISYFYLNGQFKRVEIFSESEADPVVYEIDQFNGKADECYFSTRWMRPVPVSLLLQLGSGLSSLIQ